MAANAQPKRKHKPGRRLTGCLLAPFICCGLCIALRAFVVLYAPTVGFMLGATRPCVWYDDNASAWVYEIPPETPLADLRLRVREWSDPPGYGFDVILNDEYRCTVTSRVSSLDRPAALVDAMNLGSVPSETQTFTGVLGREGYTQQEGTNADGEPSVQEVFNRATYRVELATGSINAVTD